MAYSLSPLFITNTLLTLMVLNVILNYFLKQPLFALGVNIIQSMQQYKHPIITIIFYFFTLLIDPLVVLLSSLLLIILSKQKYKSIITLIFVLFNTYLTGTLKAFYADPRPIWVDQRIQNIGLYCPQQYGNPSGHSWFAVIMVFTVMLEYAGKTKKNLYIGIVVIIMVPLSRMYLGAHSLNQVLQGLFMGLTMVYLYKFSTLKLQIQSFLKNFSSQPRFKWKKLLLILHIFYLLSFLINQDDINPYYQTIPSIWISNILQKCGKIVDTNHLNFMMLMINSLLVNISMGLAIGFSDIIKSSNGRIYLKGNWIINQYRNSQFVGKVYFYIVELFMLIGPFLPTIAIVYFTGPVHWVMFICGNLSAIAAGYLYTSKTFAFLFSKQIIRELTP